MKPFIDNNSGYEFHRRYKDNASQNLPPQWFLPMQQGTLNIKKQKTDPSQDKHGPMRKAAEKNLKKIIDTTSQCPEENIFTQFFHKKRPRYVLYYIV